jgi:hypothetical protein
MIIHRILYKRKIFEFTINNLDDSLMSIGVYLLKKRLNKRFLDSINKKL